MSETIDLTALRFRAQAYLDKNTLASEIPEVSAAIMDAVLHGLVVQLHAKVFGQEVERFRAEYPATWWDALRRDHAPRWINRRWPPRMEHWEVTAHAIYPKIDIPPPRGDYRIVLSPSSWLDPRGDADE